MNQVEEFLEVPPIYRSTQQLALLRILRIEGQLDQAILTVEDWLRKIPPDNPDIETLFAAEYGWMMREKGNPSRALEEIKRHRLKKPGVYAMSLLVERARLHAAMNEWAKAEQDIEEFFHVPSEEQKSYRNWSDACLMLGLMREQCGDQAGALEAWRQGKWDPNDSSPRGQLGGGVGIANALMLDSFCQDLDEKRTETLVRILTRDQAGIETMLNFLDTKNLFSSLTVIMNRMGHTPKAKENSRKMVLQTCSFQEYIRFPMQIFAAETVRAEAIGEKVTADQEELLWKLSADAFVAFSAGKIDELKGMQLALLWKRGPSLLGGIEVVKGLDLELRGPAAYFMGLRFQRMGRPAEELFRIALDNAPANSTVQRLTRIELEKMSKAN